MGNGADAINDGHKDVVKSPEECCDLCKSTPGKISLSHLRFARYSIGISLMIKVELEFSGCRTWTYFRLKEKWSPKGACWLRKVVGPASRCTICTTGLVQAGKV